MVVGWMEDAVDIEDMRDERIREDKRGGSKDASAQIKTMRTAMTGLATMTAM